MPPSTPDSDQPDDEAARRRYIDELVARGEVAPKGADPLPPGTTHEVVEEKDGVILSVRRRRFTSS